MIFVLEAGVAIVRKCDSVDGMMRNVSIGGTTIIRLVVVESAIVYLCWRILNLLKTVLTVSGSNGFSYVRARS
jgi:hypothetical protein